MTNQTTQHRDVVVPLRPVGYWRNADDPRTHRLPDPRDAVDRSWDAAERACVIAYLRTGRPQAATHGFSWCRFKCGVADRRMGNRDLTDGVYVWPEGFAHYLKAHWVKPPDEFIAHVQEQMALHPPSRMRRVLSQIARRLART